MFWNSRWFAFFTIALFVQAIPAHCQGGSPMPGSPVPGGGSSYSNQMLSAPVPGNEAAAIRTGASAIPGKKQYEQLPLSVFDAKTRLAELRTALTISRPQEVRDPIFHLCEWLADSADAHFKLATAFGKHDSTKAEAAAEKLAAARFSQLKNQAQLLKADLLISEKRYPEALAPLVEIVLNEPTSTTGQAAYQRLKDLGFSEELPVTMDASAPTSSLASSSSVKAVQKPASAPLKPKLH